MRKWVRLQLQFWQQLTFKDHSFLNLSWLQSSHRWCTLSSPRKIMRSSELVQSCIIQLAWEVHPRLSPLPLFLKRYSCRNLTESIIVKLGKIVLSFKCTPQIQHVLELVLALTRIPLLPHTWFLTYTMPCDDSCIFALNRIYEKAILENVVLRLVKI